MNFHVFRSEVDSGDKPSRGLIQFSLKQRSTDVISKNIKERSSVANDALQTRKRLLEDETEQVLKKLKGSEESKATSKSPAFPLKSRSRSGSRSKDSKTETVLKDESDSNSTNRSRKSKSKSRSKSRYSIS